MDIQLGILDSETTFNYARVDYSYEIAGQINTTPSGNKRIQYASNNKYLFTIQLNFAPESVWTDLQEEITNSKTNDLSLIIGEDNYTVRFLPGTIPKKPILGTALGYNINFILAEV
jgi:hypothetical protein